MRTAVDITSYRWDSSDPDRAPPPLPLNPASSSPSVASRPHTSTAIQTAHAALTEKAREAFLANPAPKRNESPERSLIKGAAHKRMQSIQTGNVRDLSNFIEGGSLSASPSRSPEKTAHRPSSPYASKDCTPEAKSPEKDSNLSTTPTPSSASIGREMPSLRPSLRRPPQSILGENTPPQSATMLALQSMSTRDTDSPLSNVTNGSTALVRTPQTFDAISNQILSLTNIATSLQREMAQLSRRSKDNATDLVSLKEATNARDEDIRKSLRELVNNLSEASSRSSSNIHGSGGYFLENKPHTPTSRSLKAISLPRIPSPNSFAASLDRESTASPLPYNSDGTVTIALLEKIIREMGTKEGQETLVARLTEVADRLAKDGVSTTQKLDDLLQFVKNSMGTEALVPHSVGSSGNGNGNGRIRSRGFSFGEEPKLELDFDRPRAGPMVSRVEHLLGGTGNKENRRQSGTSQAAELINEDILKIIRSVKDSVAQGGGLTAEVKALVRELRGEVLGMGREIGRKLDQAASKSKDAKDAAADKEHIARIVGDGLEELKQHMDRVLREARRQSSSSNVSRTNVDGQEVYNAVKSAMAEMQASQQQSRDVRDSGLQKEHIIDAVREAWENYKPDIELQHFGLEREELLECLKEGIQQYTPQDKARDIGGATREEVFTAVVEGLKHFSPPRVESEASLTREEILDAVRECLEEFEFPLAPSTVSRDVDITKDDMLDAVKEGLSSFNFPAHAVSHSRDVDNSSQLNRYGEEIVERLQEIIDFMRVEFKAVSDEAKQNVAANGRDTEQVLDATKDGLEKLRADIESYVDRAADITGKDEILDSLRDSFHSLRADVETLVSRGSENSIKRLKDELENLREALTTSVVPVGAASSNESILSGTGEILDALHDGLTGLRAEVEKIGNKPVDMTVNYEILDTLKAGLEGVRADIDRLREDSHSDRDIAAITSSAVITAEGLKGEGLKRNDIENLEVLITQLRIKVEAMESMPPPPPQPAPGSLSREDLASVEEALRDVQASVGGMSGQSRSTSEDTVRKEDVEAIETLLRNTKAKIDDMDPENIAKKDQIDVIQDIIQETRDTLNSLASQLGETSKREDITAIEVIVKDILITLDEVKERDGTKTDIETLGTLCLNMKDQIEELLASKDQIKNLEDLVKEFKEKVEVHAESNFKAFEERQAEIVGVGERVTEVKLFLEEFKDAIKEKLDEGSTGIEALGKLLEGLEETISQNANVSEDIKVLFAAMKAEFDKSNAGVVGAKLESDEKFQKTWDKMEEKFNDLMLKYDDAQMAAEAKAKAGDHKVAETEAAMLATKAVAEELKILIDTLGTTLTESVEKTDEVSKTVFNRVDDTFSKVEETRADSKAEHQLTREQISKTLNAVEGVHSHVSEYHPKILDSIKDVLLIVGQHYEHSRTSTETIQEKIAERAAFPALEQPLLKEAPVAEKYDDTQVHEKLDKLVDHMHAAGKSFAQLDMLDKIHQQVMQTAAEVSVFVSAQTQRIANDHEDKEKAVEAARIVLEKQLAQKEHVEAVVMGLREEEDRLRESVVALKAEQENLALQKMHLSADVSSLETALRIRREELHAMEARAEGLERRILEGVIDHSRALLISKSNKGSDAMNLKRVSSHATSVTSSVMSSAISGSKASYSTHSAVSMAMGGNRAVINAPINNPAGPSRRILSLNQITNNVPTGGFKRSHSVKAPGGSGTLRKTSWGGALSRREYGDLNKENLALKESEEDDSDDLSDSGTTRRMSRGDASTYGTVSGTDMGESIDEGMEYAETERDLQTPVEERGPVVLFENPGQVA